MELTALLLSRIQFAFTISFHIIFPSFTIGLAAWLTVLEALALATGRPVYRVVFEFWLKIFGVAFGLGVVSGIVMGFQFCTNWSVFAGKVGPIQGVLLSYETFTAFFLEASFFGILLFGRSRVPPWFYLFSTAMVALGTTFSAFWIMVNNSWMQVPVGYAIVNGQYAPDDWAAIIFSPGQQERQVKGRQQRRINRRERAPKDNGGDHQPGLVTVPNRRDRAQHGGAPLVVAGHAEQDPDAEVKPVEQHIKEDADGKHRHPEHDHAHSPAGTLLVVR